MRVSGRGGWLKRVWARVRRWLGGEVWDASPPSPREARIEAELAALEARVVKLLGELRAASEPEGASETPVERRGATGVERGLRKALEEEICARAAGGETAGAREKAAAHGDGGETGDDRALESPPTSGLKYLTGGLESAPADAAAEASEVVLRGVPQGICGQLTGRAGGAQFWEGVL